MKPGLITEQERAAFEAWCDRNEYDRAKRLDGTGYNNEKTKRAWGAWQARASLQAQPPAVHPAITHCDNCGCDWLDNGLNPVGCPYCKQHATVERLQNLRQGTHSHDCWSWGPKHYKCAVGQIGRDEALLRQALEALELRCGTYADERKELIPAMRKRLGEGATLKQEKAQMNNLIERMRLLELDHEQDGWPAVQMRDIIALLDAIEEAQADAERYRWLRDPCSGAERVIFYCRGDYGRGLMSGELLDEAIDRAILGNEE